MYLSIYSSDKYTFSISVCTFPFNMLVNLLFGDTAADIDFFSLLFTLELLTNDFISLSGRDSIKLYLESRIAFSTSFLILQ